jgi:DNA polymerase I
MNTPAHPKLILVDGSSYLYRAFHALPPLTNSHGEPTGAILGVVNMLRKLVADYAPEYIAVIFDAKGKTFRHEAYAEYKLHRPPMPDDLQVQIKPIHEIIAAMGIPVLAVEGVEADDVIGTLVKQAEQDNLDVLIITGDKDLAQLVNEHVSIVDTMSNNYLNVLGVEKKFGITPEQMVDYLVLVGDSSDNIPGVPKVGNKTAVKLLKEYGSLENLIKNVNKITGAVGESLRQNLSQLPLTKLLVQLKLDVVLKFKHKDLQLKAQDKPKLIALCKHFELKKWLNDLLSEGDILQSEVSSVYQTILSQEQLAEWLEKLSKADSFAFDTETNSLDTISAELIGISFAINPGEAIYIPLAHDYVGAPKQLDRFLVLNQLKPLLEDPQKIKLGHNLKFDIEVLANYGINVQSLGFDTMLESYVINSTNNRHNMDSLALQYLDLQTTSFESVAGKGNAQITFNQITLEQAAPYAAQDSDVVLKLHDKLWPQITADKKLHEVFISIEMPLIDVLARLERNGVGIDAKLLAQQSIELKERISEIEEQAYKLAETIFNLSSPKQLQEILFTKLKLPIIKKTPAGQPSTAEEVLQELAVAYPLPKLILEHRSLSKLKSTYTDSLPLQINPKTNRVHTSYNQAVTATGRLSSTNPNLQNIPIRTKEGRRVRQAFIAPIGKKIVSADYSQIELRIMAHLSQDQNLLKAFAADADIHRATAAEIFGVVKEEVNDDQRRRAKAINFGLIYGMSSFGLAQQLTISREQAQQYMNIYFERYPGIKKYMEEVRIKARQTGYVETLFGRRLYVPDIKSSNMQRRLAAERMAINAPMQGTAADIIKKAMIALDVWIQSTSLDVKMIMQVHDELVFEIAELDIVQAIESIRRFMSETTVLSIPLLVNIGSGDNWDAAH